MTVKIAKYTYNIFRFIYLFKKIVVWPFHRGTLSFSINYLIILHIVILAYVSVIYINPPPPQ